MNNEIQELLQRLYLEISEGKFDENIENIRIALQTIYICISNTNEIKQIFYDFVCLLSLYDIEDKYINKLKFDILYKMSSINKLKYQNSNAKKRVCDSIYFDMLLDNTK